MSAYDDRPWLARYAPGTPAPAPGDLPPSALAAFAAAVERAPGAVAVRYFDAPLTYAELDAHADALAAALVDRGVRPGDRVASYQQNNPQTVITMLATWKAGATMVSANPMYKAAELEHLLADSGATALVCLESLWAEVARGVVPRTDVRTVVTTSELDLAGPGEPPAPLAGSRRAPDAATDDLVALLVEFAGRRAPDPGLGPDDVALLTYTSGTTGPSKGAMNTHGNVVFNSAIYRDWAGLGPEDVILGIAPLFHITGLIGHVTVAQLCGAELLLAHRFDPAATLELIERHRPTFTVGAITAFISLMTHPDFDARDTSSLRKVWSGGAPIAPAVAEEFLRRFGCPVHNVYGLTETTSPSHMTPFGARGPVDPATGALSVGIPVTDTFVRIVGEDGADAPVGELGEIVTSGPQVVPGYWQKPEETATALAGGALRTGDIGFMDAEGWFYVVDRSKDQINASGYKVWPREVEDVLYAHPAVLEAAVVGVPDPYRGETVQAFVSLKPGAAATAEELTAFCRERMAAYKYPRVFTFVEELPKTATGKILRRELRATATRDAAAPAS
jgi:long-chain acyl-CoA synthetase